MRLRPIFERLKRAGVRNAQVLPAGDRKALDKLEGKMDLVLIDAPCTGSGVWRRRPDAKWRLSAANARSAARAEQRAVLDEGARLVKPGGRLAYITCSVLPAENRDQIDAFLARQADFKLVPWPGLWEQALPGSSPPASADGAADTLLMTPLKPWHRRLLRGGAGAGPLSRASPPVCGGPAARAKKVVARRCCDLKLINRSLK